MQSLLLLTQYFTRIPVKRSLDYRELPFRRAAHLLSFHGAFLALLPLGVSLLLSALWAPLFVNAVLTLILYLALSGAFHLDGLADSLDGLFSGRSRERILEIMKDPTMGSFGTAGIVLDLALKGYLFYELIYSGRFFLFPLMAAGGRLALCLAAQAGRRAKQNSSANLFIANVPASAVMVNLLFCLILAFSLNELLPLAVGLAVLFPVVLLFVSFCHRRIGGLVGDNLGLCAEMGELLIGIFLIWL